MSVGIAEVDTNEDTREKMELRREGHVEKVLMLMDLIFFTLF